MNSQFATAIVALFALSTSANAHCSAESSSTLGFMKLGDIEVESVTRSGLGAQQWPGQGGNPNAPVATEFVTHFHARDHNLVEDPRGMRITEVESNDPKQGRVATPRWGLPDMSTREFTFLLPHDASFHSIEVQVLHEATQNLGAFPMAPVRLGVVGLPRVSWSDPAVQLGPQGRDLSVYGNLENYPLEAIDVASVDKDRGMRILRLVFHPFRWNPASMQLTKITDLTIRVSWNKRLVLQHEVERELGDPGLPATLALDEQLVVPGNFDQTYSYLTRDTTFDYLIVATSQILANSGNLVHFITMKQSQGYKVATRSIEWIESSFPASSTQLSLRMYLKSIYQCVGLRYLMIISNHGPADVGTPGSTRIGRIPMFLTWPRGGHQLSTNPSKEQLLDHSGLRVPTDLYYADLSGPDNWDTDGDGFAGERRDDVRTYSSKPKKRYVTDFYQEIGVARIPFDDLERVDDFLADLVEYQTATLDTNVLDARRSVYLAMAEYGHWSANHVGSEETGDAIYYSIPCPWNVFNAWPVGPLNPHRMYQVGTFDEELMPHTLENLWQMHDAGLVVWSGHGDWHGSQIFLDPQKYGSWHGKNTTVDDHVNSSWMSGWNPYRTRAFVTSDSCQNASPWIHPNNPNVTGLPLLENLLECTAIGAILNTGNGIGYSLRNDNIGQKGWCEDIMVSNVRRLCSNWSLSWSIKETRKRGDYSGTGVNCGIKATNLLVSNAFGDPASFYVYQ